jgi:hypothetical protein
MRTVIGTVKTIKGTPLASLTVEFISIGLPAVVAGEVLLAGTQVTHTDTNGQFSISLSEGDYEFWVNAVKIYDVTVPAGPGTSDVKDIEKT